MMLFISLMKVSGREFFPPLFTLLFGWSHRSHHRRHWRRRQLLWATVAASAAASAVDVSDFDERRLLLGWLVGWSGWSKKEEMLLRRNESAATGKRERDREQGCKMQRLNNFGCTFEDKSSRKGAKKESFSLKRKHMSTLIGRV
jgi:hypothetical protein